MTLSESIGNEPGSVYPYDCHSKSLFWQLLTYFELGAQACILAFAVTGLLMLIDLAPAQQVELFAVLGGVILLTTGDPGWFREQDQQSDLVSMSLLFCAILASVPLAIATWIDRGNNEFIPVAVEWSLVPV